MNRGIRKRERVEWVLDDDELQFYQDEYISVLEQGEDGWWKGYVEQHPETVGLFPANYVKETESPLVGILNLITFNK